MHPDLSISTFVQRSHATALSKGWHEDPLACPDGSGGVHRIHDRVLAKIALVHSELGEAWEAYELRDFKMIYVTGSGKPEGFVVEIADALIRIFDTCGALELDLEYAVNRQKNAPDWLAETPSEDMRVDAYLARSLMRARCLLDRATEAVRIDAWQTCASHLAAVVLRLTAVCNGLGLDLAEALDAKARYNESRPHRHGGKRA